MKDDVRTDDDDDDVCVKHACR